MNLRLFLRITNFALTNFWEILGVIFLNTHILPQIFPPASSTEYLAVQFITIGVLCVALPFHAWKDYVLSKKEEQELVRFLVEQGGVNV